MNCKKSVCVFVCAILGAGFATGKELMEYFIKFGVWGILGIFISSVLFGIASYKAMSSNYTSIDELICKNTPNPLNKILSFLTFLFLIILFSAMISASGELFKSVFNLPYIYGALIMTLISLFSIKSNSKFLAEISQALFPIIIIITIITGIYITINSRSHLYIKPFDFKLIPQSIIYTSYNIITAAAVLIACKNKRLALKASALGSMAFFLLAIALSLPILLNYEAISNEPLPLLSLISDNGIVFYLYIFMLISAVFTTAFASGLSASKQYDIPPVIVALAAFLMSFMGFNAIVENVYFIFGILGGAILILIIIAK